MRVSFDLSNASDDDAVLVVDDDFVVNHLLKEWLCAAGYRCLVANTAEQGWRVLTDFAKHIWLVIVDVKMPGKYDGVGLLDRIVEIAQERNLQVVMISSNQDNIPHAVNHGCTEFMTKPIVKELLLKRVETLQTLRISQIEKEMELTSVPQKNVSSKSTYLMLDKLIASRQK